MNTAVRRHVRASAEHRPYPCLELGERERLDHEVVRTQVEHANTLALRVAPGAHDDGNRAVPPDLGEYVVAVDAGQSEVEDDEVGRALKDRAQRSRPIGSLADPVPGPLEVVMKGRPAAVVVLCDQDLPITAGEPCRAGVPGWADPSSAHVSVSPVLRRCPSRWVVRLGASIGIVTLPVSAGLGPRLRATRVPAGGVAHGGTSTPRSIRHTRTPPGRSAFVGRPLWRTSALRAPQ